MKKIIVTLLFVSFSFASFACRPAGLINCSNGLIAVDQKSFDQLLKKIKTYQGQMDKVIRYPENRSSCFNNHFANFYGDQLKTELKKNKGKTCQKNIFQVQNAFLSLVSTDSLEFRSIPEPAKDHFENEAEDLQSEIKSFFKKFK